MNQEQHAREVLLEEDDEYRDLAAQHRALESRLAELLGHAYPSDADQIEEATLKKRKLHIKDRMEHILRRHLTPRVEDGEPLLNH
jgi:uncharacterized protein YdcH (DUF465 family)